MSRSKSVKAVALLGSGKLPEARVYVLEGREDFLAEQVTSRVKRAVLETGFEDFNHQVIRCTRSTSAGQLLDALAELPVMTERRLLELRDVGNLPPPVSKQAGQALEESTRSGLVALLTYNAGRKKAVPGLVEAGRRLGISVACSLSGGELTAWVRQRLDRLGVQPGPGAVEAVVERTGEDLRLIASHLERMALLVGAGQTLERRLVEELVPLSSVVQMWKLTAAIGKRDFKQAHHVLSVQLSQKEGPGAILGYINAYVVSLVQVGGLYKELRSARAVAEAIPAKKEFQVKKTLQELKSWSGRDLEQAFEMMARADQRMKTGADARLVLELLLLQLCNRRPSRK